MLETIIGNRITPFKGRVPDLNKKVRVYRNLTKKGVFYSIKQNGLVVGSTDCIKLRNVVFTVSKTLQAKVRSEKQRNVHAYAVGFVAIEAVNSINQADQVFDTLVTYNPYIDDGFRIKNTEDNPIYITEAEYAIFNKFGLSIK
jgi:hypothetical protein